MKLYYWPGACSLSPHIVSREAGIDLQLAQLDRAERKTADGTVLSSVNEKNQVPVLELDDCQKLTERPVKIRSAARFSPTKAASAVQATGGKQPRVISGKPHLALSAVKHMSQTMATSAPPPKHAP